MDTDELVGSSAKSSDGFVIISEAKAKRFRSPPEIPLRTNQAAYIAKAETNLVFPC